MSSNERALRVEHMASTLARLGVDVSRLVRDAYAEGYRDGLAVARAECSPRLDGSDVAERWLDDSDVAERRPTVV